MNGSIWTHGRPRARGFTLIELMITVAIIGILAAIAYPMYLNKVRAARRVDAKTLLLKAANREEQIYTTQYSYAKSMADLGLPATTDNGFYTVTAAQRNGDKTKYVITATATGDQLNDTCRTMMINETGRKTALNKNGADVSSTCW